MFRILSVRIHHNFKESANQILGKCQAIACDRDECRSSVTRSHSCQGYGTWDCRSVTITRSVLDRSCSRRCNYREIEPAEPFSILKRAFYLTRQATPPM